MKLATLTALTAAASLFLAFPAQAENPDHLEQLLETKMCAGCDLSGADLSGVNLTEAYLIGADLRAANLQNANLVNANLEGADLTGANLEGANLTAALVTNAVLREADLDQADFTAARMYDVDVAGASMSDMVIVDAEIFETGIGVGGSFDELDPELVPGQN
ncbi:MAG: pentapeptide repeat-containing protein [Jaaginema sp. PMC 1079.18]|nr:pentapeptide repeat-containing protein [Jaaginema sp. PMC 1080.18]MEC4851019.1 pentapeptide repeat-containing protein [Jaaginema sp. PMC 1079.18]MEC4868024.1 pentapeptide repeat-containing protein [Jaaginema sp. PMC 1078.18]